MANLISTVLGIDVGVVNKDMIAVAGTGKYSKNVGQMRPKGSYVEQCVKTGETYILKEPTYEKYCYHCEGKNKCPYTMAMHRPIFVKDSIAGAILFLSYTKQQRDLMLNNLSNLENFLGLVSSLASNLLFKNISIDSKESALLCFESVLNEIEKPTILADKDNRIYYVNKSAECLLLRRSTEIVNTELKYFLKQLNISENIYNKIIKQPSNAYKINLKNYKFKKQCHLYANPVLFNGDYAGCIIHIENCAFNNVPLYQKEDRNKNAFSNILGKSEIICSLINRAQQAAKSTSNILLRGETGTGKELIAQGIHEASCRCDKPMIVINCGALPDNLLESELFGYVEGAFTGAKRGGKIGKFELASGGTLFLDEIGDLSFSLQAKLLRVLEDGLIEKLGSLVPKKVDVRIISATNRNLEDMVNKGTFRQDLYYRLNVISISLPPLRDRKEDILDLFKHYIAHFAFKNGLTPKVTSTQVQNLLSYYDWPGNIRELKNIAEYVMQDSMKDHIDIDDLPDSLINFYNQKQDKIIDKNDSENIRDLRFLEEKVIRNTLTKYGFSLKGKKKTAAMLGISLTTLYRRISNYGIKDLGS